MVEKGRKSERPVGLTKGAGWEIGARRTLSIEPGAAWKLVTSPRGMRAWLGEFAEGGLRTGADYRLKDGATGEVRVLSDRHLRLTWQPGTWPRPSTIQLRVLPARSGATISFHQEHLPNAEARTRRKDFFKAALDELGRLAGPD